MKRHYQVGLRRLSAWAGSDTSFIGICPSIGYRAGGLVIGLSLGPLYVGLGLKFR